MHDEKGHIFSLIPYQPCWSRWRDSRAPASADFLRPQNKHETYKANRQYKLIVFSTQKNDLDLESLHFLYTFAENMKAWY